MRVSLSPSPSRSSAKKSRSRVRRKLTILKKAMTKKSSVVKGMTNAMRVESFFCVRRRPKLSRTVDTAKSSGKWKDISNVLWDLGSMFKDKKSTWQKSCLAEEMKALGSVDENPRVIIFRGLKRIRKLGEEEETWKELLGDVQDRKKQKEDDTLKELADFMTSWDPEKRRTNTLGTNILQMTRRTRERVKAPGSPKSEGFLLELCLCPKREM